MLKWLVFRQSGLRSHDSAGQTVITEQKYFQLMVEVSRLRMD